MTFDIWSIVSIHSIVRLSWYRIIRFWVWSVATVEPVLDFICWVAMGRRHDGEICLEVNTNFIVVIDLHTGSLLYVVGIT